jgi:hypothetical protein
MPKPRRCRAARVREVPEVVQDGGVLGRDDSQDQEGRRRLAAGGAQLIGPVSGPAPLSARASAGADRWISEGESEAFGPGVGTAVRRPWRAPSQAP